MNTALLFLLALPVLVLGYRYYAKFLLLTDTAVSDARDTHAVAGADDHDLVPTPRWSLLAQHWVVLSGATTVVGTALALLWGWIPAFLWITCGTVVAAGVYGMASQWWVLRQAADDPAAAVRASLGPAAGWVPPLLMVLLLVTLGGWLVFLIARLLATYPALALPVILYAATAMAIGRLVPGVRHGMRWWLALPAALLVLALVAPAASSPLVIGGGLDLRFTGHQLVYVDAASLWALAALVYTGFAARAPLDRLARPQAAIAAIIAAVLLTATAVALALFHPDFVAPNFNESPVSRPALPWLFLVLAGGALAGLQGLFAAAVATTQMERERDLRAVGYGAALADGFVALVVLALCATGFAGAEAWQSAYSGWDPLLQPQEGLNILLAALGHAAGVTGIAPQLLTALWAMLLVVMALCALEAALRLLRRILSASLSPLLPSATNRYRWWGWWSVAAVAVPVFADGNGLGGSGGWPILLISNMLLAGLMLATCLVYMARERKPGAPLPVPAILALVLGNWALVSAMLEWGVSGSLLPLAGAGLLLVLELWWLAVVVLAYRTSTPNR